MFNLSDNVHHMYMQEALQEAGKALQKNEVPIGSVVVDESGTIIGRGHNLVEQEHQQIAHAEIKAIRQACEVQQDWRLTGCTLYVTLEPCAMCFNLMLLSRIRRLVFGAASPLFGYTLDNKAPIQVYRRNVLEVIDGICAQESSKLLKDFFKNKRKNSDRS